MRWNCLVKGGRAKNRRGSSPVWLISQFLICLKKEGEVGLKYGLWSCSALAQILVSPLLSCVALGKLFNTSDGGIVKSKLQVSHVFPLILVAFSPTDSQEALTKYVASCLTMGPDYIYKSILY